MVAAKDMIDETRILLKVLAWAHRCASHRVQCTLFMIVKLCATAGHLGFATAYAFGPARGHDLWWKKVNAERHQPHYLALERLVFCNWARKRCPLHENSRIGGSFRIKIKNRITHKLIAMNWCQLIEASTSECNALTKKILCISCTEILATKYQMLFFLKLFPETCLTCAKLSF